MYSPIPSAHDVKPSEILISVVPFAMSQCAKMSRRMEVSYATKGVALWNMNNWKGVLRVYRRWLHTPYLLTPWSRVLLENLTGFQLVKKFPAFYGTRRFITTFTSARHLSLSWASSIQSMPPISHFLKIHLNIILPSTPGSPKWSLNLRVPHLHPVYASPLPHTRYMPRPSHSSRFYQPNNIR